MEITNTTEGKAMDRIFCELNVLVPSEGNRKGIICEELGGKSFEQLAELKKQIEWQGYVIAGCVPSGEGW